MTFDIIDPDKITERNFDSLEEAVKAMTASFTKLARKYYPRAVVISKSINDNEAFVQVYTGKKLHTGCRIINVKAKN